MKIVVYTTNNCGYCNLAKKLLQTKGFAFEEINIAQEYDKRLELVERTGHRTLPQIFIDEKFIGGYVELEAYFRQKGFD